ncbi:hypothetical protein PoB_005465500 [Plakobranchus ocellatus]|uniref:Uncharacterized protein n=1 Tax=Plakobranchus ocellatus TaxID=259542 RepID=A0AAV4C613_9GAST|nr:hypothetical protein PoB_005465500 [Plakobranchus ocellatus]
MTSNFMMGFVYSQSTKRRSQAFGPSVKSDTGGVTQTRDRRVPADIRADSLATVLPTPLKLHEDLPQKNIKSPLVIYSSKKTIRKRQATFLGQVMRREKLEHLVTTGKFEGKRSRGRQREKITDGLVTWLGPGRVRETLAAVKDRDLWWDMIANAYKQGT